MKYICRKCEEVFDEDELNTVRDRVSDYAGGSYETFCECTCGGEYAEAKQCCDCGEYFAEDEMSGEYCSECLKKQATIENAIESGKDADTEISINGFAAYVFSTEEINKILIDAIEKRVNSGRAEAMAMMDKAEGFCFDDASWFAEWLEGREKNK